MNNPNTPGDELRKELRTIHNRFHGRFRTHAEVAKHSRWTDQELENVQIEDEELMYDEIMELFADRTNLITQLEAKKTEFPKVPEGARNDVLTEEMMNYYIETVQFDYRYAAGFNAGIDTAIEVLRGE